MLVQVCLLLLSAGVYSSYADSSESTTEDELFDQLEVFPENFVSKFPQESEFFRTKIIVYLFFNIFSKYFAENEPIKFWSKFNKNNFNRIAIDAVFYEYLTKFTDRKMKHLVFNPLESSTSSSEDIAIDRIGDYLDNLSAAEISTDQSETLWQTTKTIDKHSGAECIVVPSRDSNLGIPGKDFPNFCDIPKTSFTCSDKLIPGVYADIETDCQVFHVCWPDRIDSFLCPIGTTFNQALLTCDFWHESDCSSSPQLFDHSLFAKGKTLRNTESTIVMNDETLSTSENPSDSITELDIPEYDGTCQSLISKPLKIFMKFLPAKCKVRELKQSSQETTTESRKYDEKRFNRLVDVLSRVFSDALAFIAKASKHANSYIARNKDVLRRPKLKEKPIPTSDSRIVEATTEFTSKLGEIDPMNEQMYHSTTELPSESFIPWTNTRLVEKPVFETTSQEKAKPPKREPLKHNKLSEDSKKHALDVIMKTLGLGSNIMSDDVLPFMEKMILDSPKKMSKPEKSWPVHVE